MKLMRVKVVDKDDPGPAFPDVEADIGKAVHSELERVALIQDGMSSGYPSVGFIVDLPDGNVHFIELSGRNFHRLASVFKGCCQRWGVDFGDDDFTVDEKGTVQVRNREKGNDQG